MHHTTIKTLLYAAALGCCLLGSSCDDPNSATDNSDSANQLDTTHTPPPTASGPATGTSEFNGEKRARALSDEAFTGTYMLRDQESPEGGGYLVVKALDNGRLKFELDINNGPPSYHSGTATGQLVMEGNTGVFRTSEFAMEGQDPCSISFIFVEGAVELQQELGSDMTCGFGQGVIAGGVYTKKNGNAIFRYEGGR